MIAGFAVWLTGLPASGKTSIAKSLLSELKKQGIIAAHLESDELRKILTPNPTYSAGERDEFYRILAELAVMLAGQGLNVILDATATKEKYRLAARSRIDRFFEVYVDCPLEVCMQRDSKGVYQVAFSKPDANVPGIQDPYEHSAQTEITIHSTKVQPQETASLIIQELTKRKWL